MFEPHSKTRSGRNLAMRDNVGRQGSATSNDDLLCPLDVCAVTRRRFPVGASPTRPTAPAGSNRSSHGGNEMAEAFGVAGHV